MFLLAILCGTLKKVLKSLHKTFLGGTTKYCGNKKFTLSFTGVGMLKVDRIESVFFPSSFPGKFCENKNLPQLLERLIFKKNSLQIFLN